MYVTNDTKIISETAGLVMFLRSSTLEWSHNRGDSWVKYKRNGGSGDDIDDYGHNYYYIILQ